MRQGRTSSGLRPPSPAKRRKSVVATGGLSIDQRKLFTTGAKKINVEAAALYLSGKEFFDRGNGSVPVEWNDKLGQWIDTVSQLVYDRREQQQGGAKNSTHWLAFQGEDIGKMVEVHWDAKDQVWYQWDTTSNDWAYLYGKKLKWNISLHIFE